MTPEPRTPDAPAPLPDPPAVDELHVFVNGLDPVAAWVACALVGAGVCLVNVADTRPVSRSDIARGPYPAELEAQPRELALRRVLRRRSPRCVPLTAPDLFPSAAVPGTVVLNAWSVAGDLLADLTTPPSPRLDPALPTLTVLSEGANLLRWPLTSWEHRPCPECVAQAARSARSAARHVVPDTGGPLLPTGDSPLAAVTRTCGAGELAALLLAVGLEHGTDGRSTLDLPSPGRNDPARGAVEEAVRWTDVLGPPPAVPPAPEACGPVLRRGLSVHPLRANPRCLCSLAYTAP